MVGKSEGVFDSNPVVGTGLGLGASDETLLILGKLDRTTEGMELLLRTLDGTELELGL